jgi:hypothetical protein
MCSLRFLFNTTTFIWAFSLSSPESFAQSKADKLDIPDPLIVEAYERAASSGDPSCKSWQNAWPGQFSDLPGIVTGS